jgi:acetyl-CoA C-acetyltransferase
MRDTAIAGVAQRSNRITSLSDSRSPLELLVEVGAAAIGDAGGTNLAELVDAIVVVPVPMWNPRDPASVIAGELLLAPREGWVTADGGEAGISALNWAAGRIGAGELRGVLIIGGNTIRTLELAGRVGSTPDWTVVEDQAIPQLGLQRDGHCQIEAAAGLDRPAHVYPVLENALRAARGRTISEHQRFLGDLFAPFTQVAARNPNAWFPIERTPEELSVPTAENRMIAFPSTKLLNAVLATDQAAALFVGERSELQRRGADPDRLVSWWGGAEDRETAWFVSSRPDLAACPSMASAHGRTLEMSRVRSRRHRPVRPVQLLPGGSGDGL